MTQRRTSFIASPLSSLLLLGAVACSSTGASTGSMPAEAHSRGFKAVESPPCTTKQLRVVNHEAPITRIRIRSNHPGHANTRKTAVEIRLDALLVVTVKQRETGHLATTTGCWMKRESHVRRGIMTVAFLMNRAGYAHLVTIAAVPLGADLAARDWNLRVVRR